jgi:hypothetical protein
MSHEEAEAFISKHNFQCSGGYIEKFEDRHKFSSRRFHCKRRANNVSEREVEDFRLEIERLLQTVGPEKVVNIDEGYWKLFPNGMLTSTETGAENVQIETGGLEKAGITVVAAITAAGARLPLFFLAAGRTDRVHATQIGDVTGHWVGHSPSGWQTEGTFSDYLRQLSACHGGRPFHLILDKYAAHRTNQVQALAADLGITMHLIPASCTDQLQPLDRRIFGILKAKARAKFYNAIGNDPGKVFERQRNMERTKIEAVQDMVAAWEELSEDHVLSAWDIYEGATFLSPLVDDGEAWEEIEQDGDYPQLQLQTNDS